MPSPTFRCNQQLYEQMKVEADKKEVSLSVFIRTSVEHELEGRHEPANGTLDVLQKQLQEKDKQISELHQIVAISQKNQTTLVEQIEDMRQRRTVWQRFKAVFVVESA